MAHTWGDIFAKLIAEQAAEDRAGWPDRDTDALTMCRWFETADTETIEAFLAQQELERWI